MSCRVCTDLERHLHSALEPIPPDLLMGLTEAGLRNQALQREEKILKAQSTLRKHKATCVVDRAEAEAPAPGPADEELTLKSAGDGSTS